MIDLSGIQQIQARIAEIEGEFNLKQQNLPGLDFASKLQQEIDKNTAAAASKAQAAQRVGGQSPLHHRRTRRRQERRTWPIPTSRR